MDDTLIERLEAASEGSRELDCEIGVAIGRFFTRPNKGWPDRLDYCRREPGGGTTSPGNGFDQMVPRYTTSLDSAVMLIPEGWRIAGMSEDAGDGRWYVAIAEREARFGTKAVRSTAVSAAIGLCLAALTARAQAGEKS